MALPCFLHHDSARYPVEVLCGKCIPLWAVEVGHTFPKALKREIASHYSVKKRDAFSQ